jgi:predicted transposase/invertase (TIGR01784 family)
MILDVDPKVDYAFKHMLGRESTRPLLIDLTNSVLNPAPGHQIHDMLLLNPFNPKETPDDKLSILDIKARDESGGQYNIEMQMLAHRFFEKRVLYYGAKFHQQQLHEGDDYEVLKPTICICFLNDVMFPQVPNCHLRFRLLEEKHHFPLTADMEFHVLELPKFKKTADELTSSLDIWLYFLCHAEKMDTEDLPAALRNSPVVRAIEELKMLIQSDQDRERYEARRKFQLDYNSAIKSARMDGVEEGLAKGAKIGEIHSYEQLLKRPETSTENLATLALEDLTQLANELRRQVQLRLQR